MDRGFGCKGVIFLRLVFKRFQTLLRVSSAALVASSLLSVTPPLLADEGKLDLEPQWDGFGRELIHRMAGDDLHAFFGFSPRISVVPNFAPTAFAEPAGNLIVSSGLLPFLRSPSEFAFVLAHELGHILLGHTGDSEHKNSLPSLVGAGSFSELLEHELEADRFALKLLKQGNFHVADASALLARIGEIGKEFGIPYDAVNPGLKIRREAIINQLEK